MMYNIYIIMLLALTLHILLIVYGEWQDKNFDVKFTDIDYSVFTDSAKYIVEGGSPFQRHTYRYTPLLAYIMIPNIVLHQTFGKFIFSVFNIGTGFVIYKICHVFLTERSSLPLLCAMSWVFNPLTFTVSTRGNAESVMTFLILCMTYMLYRRKYFVSGALYGFSVHFKLYPVVYALPIFIHLSFLSEKQVTIKNFLRNIFLWNKNLKSFVISSFLTFVIPTVYFLFKYPNEYYNEALLYHISRKDSRHNFSPYFYLLYLTDNWETNVIGLVVFFPQLALLVLFAMKYSYGNNIMFCLFSETFIFVMFNKVCTSQYFLWFLCFLSPLIPHLKISFTKCICLVFLWFGGQAIWLNFAYQLEFLGSNMFILLWLSSLLFFIINCGVLCQIVKCYNITKYNKKR